VGSGPFRLDAKRHSDDNRECVFFLANPSYGLRSSKRNLPHIQEIRFYSYVNAVEELRSGKLDLVLDLTAEEVDKLQQQASVEAPLPTPTTPNRRIYFLAINHNKLPDANLRKALAYAINREEILNKRFRGPLGSKVHKVLNGPFPAGSWACDPSLANRQNKGSVDLYDPAKARTWSSGATVRAAGPLILKYPEGDPILEDALKDLCTQVKNTTGIELELSRCDPTQLRQDVERTQSYDLAYYHYDFPDETYWLRPLLSPPREGGDSNLFKFAHEKIQEALQDATHYRDFAKVREYQWIVQKLLTEQMPFIPLWQLDPLLAYSRAVKPASLDPLLVFTNIEEWRLKRK
jgi:ABC-type transport system substrate-binding protein